MPVRRGLLRGGLRDRRMGRLWGRLRSLLRKGLRSGLFDRLRDRSGFRLRSGPFDRFRDRFRVEVGDVVGEGDGGGAAVTDFETADAKEGAVAAVTHKGVELGVGGGAERGGLSFPAGR